MPLETRGKKREAVQAQVEYAVNEATEKTVKLSVPQGLIKADLLDISIGGCGIDSPHLIPPGVILDVTIDTKPFMIDTDAERKEPMKMVGRVTSCVMKAQSHYRMGICFTKIEKEDTALIDNFIKIKDQRSAPRWDMRK